MVVSLFLLSLVVVSLMEDFTTLDLECLIPSDVLLEISPSSNHPYNPLLKPIIFTSPLPSKLSPRPPNTTSPNDQVLCGNVVPKLDYTCRPPRHTGLFLFSGGIHRRSRPFVPIKHKGFRYVENLTPEQILAGTGVFIPRVPIPPLPPISTSTRPTTAAYAASHPALNHHVMVNAKMGKKHDDLMRNGGEPSNAREKPDDYPDELLPLELCLPEDWTY